MKHVTTYYIANIDTDDIVYMLIGYGIDATLSACLGVSAEWGREPTTAVMVCACPVTTHDIDTHIANLLALHGEHCALVVTHGSVPRLLMSDDTFTAL